MSVIDVFEVARRVGGGPGRGRPERPLVEADGFDVDLYVYDAPGEGRYHTCGRDEFFYVIKGDAEIVIETKVHPLTTGEGVLAKAGVKHRHRVAEQAWILVISKWPHKHVYYD